MAVDRFDEGNLCFLLGQERMDAIDPGSGK